MVGGIGPLGLVNPWAGYQVFKIRQAKSIFKKASLEQLGRATRKGIPANQAIYKETNIGNSIGTYIPFPINVQNLKSKVSNNMVPP